jgi:xylose isomerase
LAPYFGKYTAEKANTIKEIPFDRASIANRGLKYEKLDQLTIDLILGYR